MISLNALYLSINISVYDEIAEKLNISISDTVLWDEARRYENMPRFENIYQRLLLDAIIAKSYEIGLRHHVDTLSSHVNCIDTLLFVHTSQGNVDHITNAQQFLGYLRC